ncbi:hypothetical protein LY76DRAFT_586379 [Colletotrichum caudatum]|nr:hypothetical protein LY76DRAFT_586379 [Colletotrichum caudatum]
MEAQCRSTQCVVSGRAEPSRLRSRSGIRLGWSNRRSVHPSQGSAALRETKEGEGVSTWTWAAVITEGVAYIVCTAEIFLSSFWDGSNRQRCRRAAGATVYLEQSVRTMCGTIGPKQSRRPSIRTQVGGYCEESPVSAEEAPWIGRPADGWCLSTMPWTDWDGRTQCKCHLAGMLVPWGVGMQQRLDLLPQLYWAARWIDDEQAISRWQRHAF